MRKSHFLSLILLLSSFSIMGAYAADNIKGTLSYDFSKFTIDEKDNKIADYPNWSIAFGVDATDPKLSNNGFTPGWTDTKIAFPDLSKLQNGPVITEEFTDNFRGELTHTLFIQSEDTHTSNTLCTFPSLSTIPSSGSVLYAHILHISGVIHAPGNGKTPYIEKISCKLD